MQNLDAIRKNLIPQIPLDFRGQITDLVDYIQTLETKIRLLEHRKYGRSSEKFTDKSQPSLFNEAEECVDELDKVEDDTVEIGPYKRRRKRKPQLQIPENIERNTKKHELSEDERKCECCGEVMAEIGEDVSEKIDIIPPKLVAARDIYIKYACKNKNCDGKPKQAPRPPVAIPKIKATSKVLAFIAVQKYQYALPLYRLEYLFSTLGVVISRYVMSLWMIKLADALRPIYLSLEEQLLAGRYLNIDETTVQVLREPGRAATSKSYMWLRTNGDSRSPPIVLYHYSPSRSAEVAKKIIGDFSGYLQSDDYAGYSCVLKERSDITHLLCWDHTRRYFWEAYQAIPKKKRHNTVSEQVLNLIKKLYKVEEDAKELSNEDRLKLRKERSVLILEKIKKLCEEKLPGFAPKSPTSRAILYMLDNWEKLLIYLSNGELNISNALAERKIRPFTIGRKNWMFSNSVNGAEASAIIYSIVETAKANDLDPYTYINEALEKLPLVKSADDLGELLPLKQVVH